MTASDIIAITAAATVIVNALHKAFPSNRVIAFLAAALPLDATKMVGAAKGGAS